MRRTNSQITVTRKPSVKTKPEVSSIRKPDSPQDCSDNKMCVRAKICYLEIPHSVSGDNPLIEQPKSDIAHDPPINSEVPPTIGNVKATIEIFERRTSSSSTNDKPKPVPKPRVPEKNFALKAQEVKLKNSDIKVTVFKKDEPAKPVSLPYRKCDSMYETLNVPKVSPQSITKVRSAEAIPSSLVIQANSSFLWRTSHERILTDNDNQESEEDWKSTYDAVDVPAPAVPPRPPAFREVIVKKKLPLPQEDDDDEKIYEELHIRTSQTTDDGYEYCKQTDDGYEYCSKTDNIYESVPPPQLPPRKAGPLPPRPSSRSSTSTLQDVSNCYESIAEKTETEGAYESIYHLKSDNWSTGSNRDSLLSSDQQSNSLYGKAFAVWGEETNVYKAGSDLSWSERSDEWIDLSEGEEGEREASQEVVM